MSKRVRANDTNYIIPRSKRRKTYTYICTDILQYIFSFMQAHEVINCSLVSKEWFQASSDDIVWKQLFKNRFQDRIFHGIDKKASFYEQYKTCIQRLYSKCIPSIMTSVPSEEDEKEWNRLTDEEKDSKIKEYYVQYVNFYEKKKCNEAFHCISKILYFLEKEVKQVQLPNMETLVVLLNAKVKRLHLLNIFGYAMIVLNEFLDTLRDITELMTKYDQYITEEGLDNLLTEFMVQVSLDAAIAQFSIKEYNQVSHSCNFGHQIVQNKVPSLSLPRLVLWYPIIFNHHVNALQKLGKWEKIAENVGNLIKLYFSIQVHHQSIENIHSIFKKEIEKILKWPKKQVNAWMKEMNEEDLKSFEKFCKKWKISF